MLIFEVESGEMVESIEAQAKSAGLTRAAIVSLIGGVDSFTVSTMPVNDPTKDVVSD